MTNARDLHKARKLIRKLAGEADGEEAGLLWLADEAVETVVTRTYFLSLNTSARKEVEKLYQDARGRPGAMWNHVLRLIEDYAAGRRS